MKISEHELYRLIERLQRMQNDVNTYERKQTLMSLKVILSLVQGGQ